MRTMWLVSLAVVLAGAGPAWALAGATFQGLGNFPNEPPSSSEAWGVSSDGTTVVGYGNDGSQKSFRWTAAGGMENLDGTLNPAAYAVSTDGSVVVGGSGGLAYCWTGGTMTSLGTLPGGTASLAYGVSGNGAIVVGSSTAGTVTEACLWTTPDGVHWEDASPLVDLPGGAATCVAYAIATDGSAVVGQGTSASGAEACLWTPDVDGNWVASPLGDLAGGTFYSLAYGVSADGAVVVGVSKSAAGDEAFRWTAADGMKSLGDLEGDGVYSQARAVSADGAVVVGRGRTAAGYEAFIWTAEDGMQNLKALLQTEYGIDLSDWKLIEAFGISADGSVIVGRGSRISTSVYEAWVVKIPVVVPPVADPNGPYVASATSWNGASVQLDGTASYDPNHPDDPTAIRYQWDLNTAVDGPDPDNDTTNDVDSTEAQPWADFPIGQTEISLVVVVVVDDEDLPSAPVATTVTVSTIDVEIDIRPGDDTNTINLGSHGAIPVAFLTTPDFDASTIDPTTVTLRGEDFTDGLVKLRGKKQEPMAELTDVDGDGDLDLLVHLETEKLAEYEIETTCDLGALTYDGYVVSGSDTIRVK